MTYDARFFDYVDSGAVQSARALIGALSDAISPQSVLDIGCGRGAWLRSWKEHGVNKVHGLDGDYIDPTRLYIDPFEFTSVDVSRPFNLGQTFDLVQSLEVGEHLSQDSAAGFVSSITNHGNIVMFSAAVPGQGGTQHVNEQPLEYWRDIFYRLGYSAYNYIRPKVYDNRLIEPWYRWNTVLYANAQGELSLSKEVRDRRLRGSEPFKDYTNLPWRIRRALVAPLPVAAVDVLAGVNAKLRRITRGGRA